MQANYAKIYVRIQTIPSRGGGPDNVLFSYQCIQPWADPDLGTGGPDPSPPLKIHKNIGFPSNTGPDPLKKHKQGYQGAFNVGPSSARQRNAI